MNKVKGASGILFCGFFMVFSSVLFAQKKETVEIKRIWDHGGHNAFTDITFFKNRLFVVFREADAHIPNKDNTGNGKIRILSSLDGDYWENEALIELNGVDLRDPKLSVTPKKRLMIVMGGSQYDKQELKGISSYVSMSDTEGKKFDAPQPIVIDAQIKTDFDWLWRVTWHDKIGYGVVYQSNVDGEKGKSKAYLVKTEKGIEYEMVTQLNIDGDPNEATIRFLTGAEMMIVVRRNGDDKMGMLGTSKAPYTDWTWEKLDYELGGPNFEIIPIDKILIGARIQGQDGPYSALLLGKRNEPFKEVLKLPSGGDTGYPGFYSIAGYVWLSYYSSHEGKACIYYARIPYAELTK